MHVDANTNVGPSVYSDFEFDPTLEALSENLERANVDAAVVAPLKPPSFDFDRANERLAEDLGDRGDRYGIARIDPRVEEAARHTERALVEYDLNGVKLHPWEETFSITSSVVEPVLSVVETHDVPVWIHAGYPNVSHALSVRRVARSHPDVPFVLTHACQLDVAGASLPDVKLLAEETDNTYFELSGTYRRDLIRDLVDRVGSERVLFGSNAPYFDVAVEKSRVTHADLSDSAKATVLGKSVLNLLR